MELEDVKGVGSSAADKLEAAGIGSVETLSEADQRKVDIEGLSAEHVAQLRENARRLLEAVDSGDLTLVDGLGPSAADKLNAHGVERIADLVDLDLRSEDVEGLSTENLQKLKRNAEYLVPDA
jgi:predicted RecB family nuclease